jgi:hypothetical protein
MRFQWPPSRAVRVSHLQSQAVSSSPYYFSTLNHTAYYASLWQPTSSLHTNNYKEESDAMDDDKSKIVILIVDSPVKFALFDFFTLRPKNI